MKQTRLLQKSHLLCFFYSILSLRGLTQNCKCDKDISIVFSLNSVNDFVLYVVKCTSQETGCLNCILRLMTSSEVMYHLTHIRLNCPHQAILMCQQDRKNIETILDTRH